MDARELIRVHLELECIGIDANGFLVPIPCANPDDLFRFYIAQHESSYSRYFRYDLPDNIVEQLTELAPDIALNEHDVVKRILEQDAPCEGLHAGKSYIFPDNIPTDRYPDAVRLETSHQELITAYISEMEVTSKAVYAVIQDGKIVSTCESSRENAHAGEAWVQTLPEYRGRGYAHQVTAAWAHDLQCQGKIPFYSHQLHNMASQAVAQKSGLKLYATDTGYV